MKWHVQSQWMSSSKLEQIEITKVTSNTHIKPWVHYFLIIPRQWSPIAGKTIVSTCLFHTIANHCMFTITKNYSNIVWDRSKRSGKGSLWINHNLMNGNNSFITWSMQIYKYNFLGKRIYTISITSNKIAWLDNKDWRSIRFFFRRTDFHATFREQQKKQRMNERTNEKPARKCIWFAYTWEAYATNEPPRRVRQPANLFSHLSNKNQ